MTRVKQLVLALVLDLFLFYNIERLSFGEEYYHFINIQGFVYLTGAVAVMATLVIPRLRRWSVLVNVAIWMGIYALCKFVLIKSPTHPALGGFNTFVTFAEAVFLALTVAIAHALAVALHDFHQAVENITLSGISHRLRRVDDARQEIQTELVRSRRYQSPLSVIVVQPEENSFRASLNRAVEQIQKAMMSRYVLASMASVLTNSLRRTDLVLEQGEKGRFIVFSPETDVASSTVLAEHIQSIIADRLQIHVHCGVAGFPEDALTFDELVRRAEKSSAGRNTGTENPRMAGTPTSGSSPAE